MNCNTIHTRTRYTYIYTLILYISCIIEYFIYARFLFFYLFVCFFLPSFFLTLFLSRSMYQDQTTISSSVNLVTILTLLFLTITQMKVNRTFEILQNIVYYSNSENKFVRKLPNWKLFFSSSSLLLLLFARLLQKYRYYVYLFVLYLYIFCLVDWMNVTSKIHIFHV